MKNVFTILAAACLVLALGAGPSFGNTEVCNDLVADGGSDATAVTVGQVCVYNDGSSLFVEYHMNTGWCITQTHTHVATAITGIPQKNGNPIPGKFDQKETFASCVYEAGPYSFALNTTNIVAAHAVVWDESSSANLVVVSNTDTQVIAVNGVPQDSTDAVLAMEPFNYPNCASYTPDDTSQSLWDQQIGTTAFSAFTAAGADWIWSTPHPVTPIEGEVVTFQEIFSVPGLPVSADLLITADNAFMAELNGADVGSSVSLGPGFPDTLKEQIIAVPQDDDWGVASQGWQKVELFPLGAIVSGENTLTITAADEYMCGGNATICNSYEGNDRYYGWNNTSKTYTTGINNDPIPGNGPGFQPCYNPGGLIFKASVDYYSRSETAWGDGTEFAGSNWATYITYSYTPPSP